MDQLGQHLLAEQQLGQPLLAEQQLGQLLLEEQQLGQLLLEELQVQQQGQVGLLDQVELQDAVSRAELAPQQAEQLLEQQAWASALPWPLPLAQLSVHELSPCDQKNCGAPLAGSAGQPSQC